nr:uncharacterized protein LOC109173529 [Ipomoea batatas]
MQEEEDDDSWLASIDFDAMVSQFIQNPTTSSQVTAVTLPITSQLPPLGEDEDSQEPISKTSYRDCDLSKKFE